MKQIREALNIVNALRYIKFSVVFFFLLLVSQNCSEREEDMVTPQEEPLVELSSEELLSNTQEWFKETSDAPNARAKTKWAVPQWKWTNQSRNGKNGFDIVVVPIYKEGALHNNVQLVTYHYKGKITLGFILEAIADSTYRESYDLEITEDFRGVIKLYDKEERLIKVFNFGKSVGTAGNLNSKLASVARSMSTLRTASGEDDPIYDCGCSLDEVVVTAGRGGGSPSGSGGSYGGGVIVSGPESIFTNTGPMIGGGSSGGSSSSSNSSVPTPMAPVATLSRIKPQLDVIKSIPNVEVKGLVEGVDALLLDPNTLTKEEAQKVAHSIENLYGAVQALGKNSSYIPAIANSLKYSITEMVAKRDSKVTSSGIFDRNNLRYNKNYLPLTINSLRDLASIKFKGAEWQRNIIAGNALELAYKAWLKQDRNFKLFTSSVRTKRVRPDFVRAQTVLNNSWKDSKFIQHGVFVEVKATATTVSASSFNNQIKAEIDAVSKQKSIWAGQKAGPGETVFVLVVPENTIVSSTIVTEATVRGVSFFVSYAYINVSTGKVVFSTPDRKNFLTNLQTFKPYGAIPSGVSLDWGQAIPRWMESNEYYEQK